MPSIGYWTSSFKEDYESTIQDQKVRVLSATASSLCSCPRAGVLLGASEQFLCSTEYYSTDFGALQCCRPRVCLTDGMVCQVSLPRRRVPGSLVCGKQLCLDTPRHLFETFTPARK